MIDRPEDEELFLVTVPVATHTAKSTCPVVQGVVHDAHRRLLVRDDFTFEIGILRKSHANMPPARCGPTDKGVEGDAGSNAILGLAL